MYNTRYIGKLIRDTRKKQNLTQQDLALVCNTGSRFISELENGKESCHWGKTLKVLQNLGIKINLETP